MLGTLRKLLVEATPEAEFSAIYATILLNNNNYTAVKTILQEQNLWTSDLKILETAARHGRLDSNA